ncbi:4Fe-4S binding protein [Candidatus Fermentibacteria bacterium]|nr:4Fe-4S binding protein [Candidatus Fermentibacteria bacterium]
MTHRALRRTYQTFFLLLFLFLLTVGRTGWIRGWPVDLFFHADPLLAIGTMLSSRSLHGGLALSLGVVLATVFLGRVFCGWVCPLGTLNDAIGWRGRGSAAKQRAANAPRALFRTKYYLLVGFLVAALLGTLLAGMLDPLSLVARGLQTLVGPLLAGVGVPLFSHDVYLPGGILPALLLASVLAANRFIPRLWCKAFCPLGALLGLLSRYAPFGIGRDSALCTSCGVCDLTCSGAATPSAELARSECVVCMNCRTRCPEGALSYGRVGAPVPERRPPGIDGRRAALAAVVGLVAWPAIRAGSPSPAEAAERRVRPPGAVPEDEFLARCARCGLCARSCPTGVIQLATSEAGVEGIWTPVMRFDAGYCEVSCVLCGHVCPTGAIQALTPARKLGREADEQTPVKIGTAFYDRGRCLPWAMDRPCVVCEEVCPVSPKAIWTQDATVQTRDGEAITLKRPQVDPARCIGCGICQYHCPVEDRPAIRVSAVGESRGGPFLLS